MACFSALEGLESQKDLWCVGQLSSCEEPEVRLCPDHGARPLQGPFLLASLRGAEGLLPLLPDKQGPEGGAAEDVGGGADQ